MYLEDFSDLPRNTRYNITLSTLIEVVPFLCFLKQLCALQGKKISLKYRVGHQKQTTVFHDTVYTIRLFQQKRNLSSSSWSSTSKELYEIIVWFWAIVQRWLSWPALGPFLKTKQNLTFAPKFILTLCVLPDWTGIVYHKINWRREGKLATW